MHSRLAKLATGRRTRWVVIGAWVALAAALFPLHSKLQDAAEDESDTFLVRGSESAEADRLLDERFDFGGDVSTVVVYSLPAGQDIHDVAERIGLDAAAMCVEGVLPDVRAVITPFELACGDLSQSLGPETPPSSIGLDGSAAITTILTKSEDTERVMANVEAIREIVAAGLREHGGELDAYVTGQGGFDADRARAVEGIDETLMTITAVLILVLLLAIFRSPVAAAVPLFVVAVAYLVAAGIAWGLVSAGLTSISGQSTAILIVLMFGAGTDYCLLLVSRFREEISQGGPGAVERAAIHTGPTIVSAGAIVVAAMLALTLADFNATREMGPILGLGIAVMVLAGLTLLPAVLASLGPRAFWPGDPAKQPARSRLWSRAAALVERRPALVGVLVTALLAAGALGNLSGRETLTFDEAFRGTQPESVHGQEVIREKFPPGRAAPQDLVMSGRVSGSVITGLGETPGLESVHWNAGTSTAGDEPADELILADVQLAQDPLSEAARDSIPELRARIAELVETALETTGDDDPATAVLGGFTAESYDTAEALRSDALLIVPVALALILIILGALLRAAIAPLYVVATVILSFGFALGISSLAFTHLFGQPASDPSLAIFSFIFLVGLGVDYNVFLLSRIREERDRGLTTREAVRAGLERTGGVITGAGLILAGTFAALMALELEALFQVGFTVALGLLVDTFAVRALLVPAITVKLGERAWWPGFARGSAKADLTSGGSSR